MAGTHILTIKAEEEEKAYEKAKRKAQTRKVR